MGTFRSFKENGGRRREEPKNCHHEGKRKVALPALFCHRQKENYRKGKRRSIASKSAVPNDEGRNRKKWKLSSCLRKNQLTRH